MYTRVRVSMCPCVYVCVCARAHVCLCPHVCVCLSVCQAVLIRSYVIVGLNKTAVSEGSQSLNLKSPSALISETDKSPHSLPPVVAHIDTSLMTLPDSEPSARLSSQPLVTDGGASGELISKGLSLESSVDPSPLTTYMPSPLSSLTNTSSNVAMTLTGPIGNFSFNSQKLLSPAEFVSSPPHSLSSFHRLLQLTSVLLYHQWSAIRLLLHQPRPQV